MNSANAKILGCELKIQLGRSSPRFDINSFCDYDLVVSFLRASIFLSEK